MFKKKQRKSESSGSILEYFKQKSTGSETPVDDETERGPKQLQSQPKATSAHADNNPASTSSESIQAKCTTPTGKKKAKVRIFKEEWTLKYPWLRYDHEQNLMFCSLCENGKKENTLGLGTDNYRTSTLSRHISHPDHQLLLGARALKRETEKMIEKHLTVETKAVKTAMKAVYFIAKEHLPLAKYPSIIKLFRNVKAEYIQHLTGGPSTNYNTSYAAGEFLNAINEDLFESTSKTLCEATAISIIADESCDITVHKKLAIWARVVNTNVMPSAETLFLADLPIEQGTGVFVAQTILHHLQERGVNLSNLTGFGSDGATVMTGRGKGVTGQLLAVNPHLINVHCSAHRVALVTSQTAESFPALKDYQQSLTDLFYYFHKSAVRSQALEDIQTILESPRLKIKEIHQVRWLSFFDALHNVYKMLPALVTYFDSIKKQKDPKGEGIGRKLCTSKFVYLTCMMMDTLAPITVLSQQFQKRDLDAALVRVHLDTCTSALSKFLEDETPDPSYLKEFEDSFDKQQKTYKDMRISVVPLPTVLCKQFVKALIDNLEKRFPQLDIIDSMGIFGLRPLSFVSPEELESWGNEQLEILIDHYGQEKQHTWKDDDGTQQTTKSKALVDPQATRAEWGMLKRVVLAEKYPRDNMSTLWQCISTFHRDDIPNLMLLYAQVSTCPIHSADCERSFSVQNYTLTSRRANLTADRCDQLMRVCISGPEMTEYDFEPAIKSWRKKKSRLLYSKRKQSETETLIDSQTESD